MWFLTLQKLSIQFVLDVLYFPVWWYSAGLFRAWSFYISLLRAGNDRLVPLIWLHNIFVPMYGQYDWQGRIMSFFMRTVNVIFRLCALAVWSAVSMFVVWIWVAAPVLVVYAFAQLT